MVIARRNGETWTVKLRTLVVVLGAMAAVGGLLASSITWLGLEKGPPGQRIRSIEERIDRAEARADTTRDLLRSLVSFQCLTSDTATGQMMARARVACARVLREQGIIP